jgi:hypothetical protein
MSNFSAFSIWVNFALSLAVGAFAFRWRKFWSVRFLLAAAILNVLILYAMDEVNRRANGINAPGTPDWLVAPIFLIGMFLPSIVLVVASLSLLSFLPGSRRRGSRRDNLFVFAAVAVLGGLLACVSFRMHAPPQRREALNPEKTFYPKRALSSLLQVQFNPKQDVFINGTGTQFEVTFRNCTTRDISLGGMPFDGLRFRPYIWVQQMRGGKDLSWGTDLHVPLEHDILRSGQTWTFDFPERPQTRRIKSDYDEDRQILQPGDYSAFLAFWLERDGEFERVLSNVANFSVR